MRGYVPQYDLAARLIYEAMASGRLRWVGLADPLAGKFDDIVLGFEELVLGYQVKSSRDPDKFRLETLLLGANGLLGAILDAWKRQRAEHGHLRVELRYATDDYPDTRDHLEAPGTEQISSAVFLRGHEAHRGAWTLGEWRASPFGALVEKLVRASSLNDEEFSDLWCNLTFETGGSARLQGLRALGVRDQQRQGALASLLPKLIAGADDKRRWSTSELLQSLGWQDPFRLRRSHTFPTDLLTQANVKTEAAVQEALEKAGTGYVSLIGPPGSGKSTLLQAGMVPIPNSIFVRYLAFVPDEGHGLGRAEATDFLQDVIVQLKGQGLGPEIMPGVELAELQQQFEKMLGLAGERFAATGRRTVIIVDGLDHIPREEQPQHSLLRGLPLPHTIPQGVLFLLGTQKLDLDGIPRSVRDQATKDGRRIDIAPLPREAIYRLAEAYGLPADVDRGALYDRSEGHPLAARYLIEGLARLPTEAERTSWLSDEPSLGGDAEAYYQRAWHDIEDDVDAQLALSYVALSEGSIDPVRLDELVGRSATNRAERAAIHLLRVDKAGRWSIFHNSFRLFLLERTSVRHGRKDEAELRRRYIALADMARQTDGNDAQRWMELRYRARAQDEPAVLALAVPGYFRRQFVEGRNPGDIQADIRLAFAATRKQKNIAKFFELLLCRHEIEMRTDAVYAENIVDAYIAGGDLEAAKAAIAADDTRIPVKARYTVIHALLEAKSFDEARALFERIEPIEKLLGWADLRFDRNDDEVYEWAKHVLIFKGPHYFVAALDRLQISNIAPDRERDDLEVAKGNLKFFAARTAVEAAPGRDFGKLIQGLQIDEVGSAVLRLLGAEAAVHIGADDLVKAHLKEALPLAGNFNDDLCLRAATAALQVGDKEMAAMYFGKVTVPTTRKNRSATAEQVASSSDTVLAFSTIEAQLSDRRVARAYPAPALLKAFQEKLETVGSLLGKGRAGKAQAPDVVWREIQKLLLVMAFGETEPKHERLPLNGAMTAVANAVVDAAAAHGSEALQLVVNNIDDMLETNPGHLRYPSFRRPYAVAVYDYERNTARALERLPVLLATEEFSTPHEYVSEVCEQAIAVARVGDQPGARRLLNEMHESAFGISLPPRKDGQYEMWLELFERANSQDPARRTDRIRRYARFLDGLSRTEGAGAARRMARDIIEEAAVASPALATTVFSKFDTAGISSWPTLVSGLLAGIAKARPDLAVAVASVFNHMVLPCTDEFSDSIYSTLIPIATGSDKQTITDSAVERIEVEANAAIRLRFLDNIYDLARTSNISLPDAALVRWKSEHVETTSSSHQSPYASVISLDGLKAALVEYPPDSQKNYGAVYAFERVAPSASYAEAKAIMAHEAFADDDRAILVAARSAIAAGELEEASAYVDRFRTRAERDGSWGLWQSGAKLRLHRLLTDLDGDAATERAFDVLAQDLSLGREWSGTVIPDIATILEVAWAKPDWVAIWDILAEHLAIFRDYRAGTELGEEDHGCASAEDLIAEILCVAAELMTADLSRQVRFVARDLIRTAPGTRVVVALIQRLWDKKGDLALEGVRIAWETRSSAEIQSYVRSQITSWVESDDLGVLRCAMAFAHELDIEVPQHFRALPQFYELEYPESSEATKFSSPAGFSSTDRGLWTEDPYSWTWPLERPLRILARATGYGVPILRRRIAELMRRNGGRDLFGPEPVKAQYERLTRLHMRVTYHRLSILAAFRATREAAAEFVRAQQFDFDELNPLLNETGAANPTIPSIPPLARPRTILRPHLAPSSWMKEVDEWVQEQSEGPAWPTVPGYRVLAAAGSFDITSMRRELVEEHLFLRGDLERPHDELEKALGALPRALILGRPFALYDDISPTGVAAIAPDLAGSIPNYAIMLCPVLTQQINLHSDPGNPMSYLDEDGIPVVRTIWWRDGGVRFRAAVESPVRGDGHVIVVSETIWPKVAPYLAGRPVSYRWRHATSHDSGTKEYQSKSCKWLASE